MYVYCVYPVVLQSLKHLPNCLKRAETKVVLTVYGVVLCEVKAYTDTVSYRCSTRVRY